MEIVIRASVAFVFLLVFTRVLRRRTLAELAPFEMLLLVMVGDIVQQGITQEDQSITGGVLAATTLGVLATALAAGTWRWNRMREVVEGRPLIVIRGGEIDIEMLRLEPMPVAEVLEAARQNGISDLTTVSLGILEPNGRFSFLTS